MLDKLMKFWRELLDSFDTAGGHIFLLVILAYVMVVFQVQSMEKFQGEIVGGLLVALKGQGSAQK